MLTIANDAFFFRTSFTYKFPSFLFPLIAKKISFFLIVFEFIETFLIFNQEIIGHIQGELNQEKWQSTLVPLINAATMANR